MWDMGLIIPIKFSIEVEESMDKEKKLDLYGCYGTKQLL